MKKMLICAALVLTAAAKAGLVEDFNAQERAYIFVSTNMTDSAVIALAKEAKKTNSILVYRGMKDGSLTDAKNHINKIQLACCGKENVNVIVHPQLFDRYRVDQVPTFVLAKGESTSSQDFVKVSGNLSFGEALKLMHQKSLKEEFSIKAKNLYEKAFSKM